MAAIPTVEESVAKERAKEKQYIRMLNIMSLFRNSINGLKGLGVTNDTDKGTFSPLASPKLDKKHITFDGQHFPSLTHPMGKVF